MAKYGTSGYATIVGVTSPQIDVTNVWHFVFNWKNLETTADVWNWSTFDAQIAAAISDGFYVSLIVIFSPDSFTPAYLYSAPYSVPKVTTDSDIYPYYFNPSTFDSSGTYAFKTRFNNMLDQVRAHLATLSAYTDGKVLFWQSAEGTTGDAVPYHGTITGVTINGAAQPTPSDYDISDSDWTDYVRTLWTQENADIISDIPLTTLLINPNQDGTNWEWKETNLPNIYIKATSFAHNYSFPGESYFADFVQAQNALGLIARDEIDSPPLGQSWWDNNPNQNTMALLAGCLNAGVNNFNLAVSAYAANTTSDDAYVFYNTYARISTEPYTTGFIYFRDVLDFNDTTRFPEGTYGNVIAPASQATYDAQVAAIMADPTIPDALKQYDITFLTIGYHNTTRITNIQGDFPTALYGVVLSRVGDQYNNDFGCDTWAGSWSSGVTIFDQYNTSTPHWRYATDPYFFGRYGLSPNSEMFMSVDFSTNESYQATITVTYFDGAVGVADVNYYNGSSKVAAGTITTGNSSEIMSVTYVVNNFYGGGNFPNDTDISLENISGNSIIFGLLTISLIPNAMAFTPNFTADQLATLTDALVTDTSTGTDGAITSRRIYFQKYDGTHLVPDGTLTDYVLFPLSSGASIEIDDLFDKSYGLSVRFDWLNVSNVVLYSKTIISGFSQFIKHGLYQLTQYQIPSGSKLLQQRNYLNSKLAVWDAVRSGDNAITTGSDITNAQISYDSATNILSKPELFY